MKSTYRTLLFCQRIDDAYMVFYGHTIYWQLTELDYLIEGWKRRNIQGDIYVFFSDLPGRDEFDLLVNNKKLDLYAGSKEHFLLFNWSQTDAGFLNNDASNNEFKPFSSLCSKVMYYFSDIDSVFVDNFFQENKDAISKLEEEYAVPLTKNPHLVNTLAIYTPTRIETSLQSFRGNDGNVREVAFYINDTFSEYQGCDVSFLLTCDGEKEEGVFKLSDEPKTISTRFDPDYMELAIKDSGEVVFEEKCYFIKSIKINMNVVSGSISTSSGSVPIHSSSSFTIGDDSE